MVILINIFPGVLTVGSISEERKVLVLKEMREPLNDPDWVRMEVSLPNGINQVVIQAERGKGLSGLAIDDVKILPCHNLG